MRVLISRLAMAAVALGAAAAIGWTGWPGGTRAGEPIAVAFEDVTVVDGETIRVRGVLGGDRIRLLGYDTPEVSDPDCPDEAELGRFATATLEGMLRSAAGRIDR